MFYLWGVVTDYYIEVYISTEEYKHYISIVSCDLNLNVFFHISNRHTVEWNLLGQSMIPFLSSQTKI